MRFLKYHSFKKRLNLFWQFYFTHPELIELCVTINYYVSNFVAYVEFVVYAVKYTFFKL